MLDLFFTHSPMPTVLDNASGSDANAQQNYPEISDEVITSHPKYKELEEKHSAARTGMDKSNLTKKQLEAEVARLRVMAGEEEQVEVVEAKPSFVTREELQSTAWEIAHAKDLELYGDEEYKNEVSSGIPKETALKYAKLRFQKSPNQVQVSRQQSMASSGQTSTRDLSNVDITDEDRADMKLWGYSEKTLLKQKELKRARS